MQFWLSYDVIHVIVMNQGRDPFRRYPVTSPPSRLATSLGGEYVGGEIVPWWRDRSLVASSLVASLPGGEVTGNPLER